MKMRIMSLIFTFVLLALASLPSLGGTITVTTPSGNIKVGDTFRVDIVGTGFTDLYAYQFEMFFDPSKLKAVAAIEGEFLKRGGTTFFKSGEINNTTGDITAIANTLIGPIPGVAWDNTLTSIEFTAIAPGSSTIALGFSNGGVIGLNSNRLLLLDSTGNSLPGFQGNNGFGVYGIVNISDIQNPPRNSPPLANADSDQVLEATSSVGSDVVLDGTGSNDPDGDVLTYTWTGLFGTASGANPTVSLPLGTHTIALVVHDGKGGTASDEVIVQVVDSTPPNTQLNVVSGTLGGNGWYVNDVTVRASGTDPVSGIASCIADQSLTTESSGTTFNGSCTDQAGNTGNAAPLTIKRDSTAPATVGDSSISGNQATVTLTASDALSGVAETRYNVNGGAEQTYTGPFVLTGAGAKTVNFFSTDRAGNKESGKILDVTIGSSTDACTAINVVDNFNRANGALGNNWRGTTGTSFYRIAGNKLDVQAGGPILWNAATFGTSQAAAIKLSSISTKSPTQGLLLKVQGRTEPSGGAIAIVYDGINKAVRVSTLRLGVLTWKSYGNTSVAFANGDKLGACAKATGEVHVFKNDQAVATITLNAADQAFFNGKGGRAGLWNLFANDAVLDDFGAGTAQ